MRSFPLLAAALVFTALSLVHARAQTALVNHGDVWHYRFGTNAAQANWQTVADASLDGTWLSGPGGIGYSDGDDGTNIQLGMSNKCTTVYIRRSFQIAAPVETNVQLTLTMDYDDGFVAYLDGAEIARGNTTNGVGTPVVFNATTASHEASAGGGSPPTTYNLGAVSNRLEVGTHVLAIHGINQNLPSSDLSLIADLFLGTGGCPPNTICGNTNWTAANSPYVVSASLTIAAGAALTIEPGVIVQFGPGVNLTVADGGRLLAEGSSNAPIHLTHTSGNWGHITIDGSVGSAESRIAYADFEFNVNNTGTPCIEVAAGTAYLDHLTFRNSAAPYIHVDGASFVISHCYFPSATASFELVHGVSGIKSGGHGIFYRNYFGIPIGYNDVVDFTGGNRPGPIVQFFENVFNGATDDCLDLDSTDAWVEGNIFLHVHRNGAPDSSSGVSGGSDNASNSEITIIRNIFYDCDQAAMGKQTNFYTLLNNTIVHQSHIGGQDPTGAVVNLVDPTFSEGRGMYLEGNIVYDAEALTRGVTTAIVTYTNNILPLPWTGLGGDNLNVDPMFKHVPQLSETTGFNSWESAQVFWDWFSLLPGSPAIGAGPNGYDLGAVIPMGAFISGEPAGTTTNTSATLRVGINRTGNGIPPGGWPNGSGYVSYKWRLDGGPWSAETPINTRINLTGLADGPHHVEVNGKRDTALFQDDPLLGEEAVLSQSRTWTVQTVAQPQVISASHTGATTTITFLAVSGQTYSVLYRDAFDAAHPWAKLVDVPAQGGTGPYTVIDNDAAVDTRFYEIVTPAQ